VASGVISVVGTHRLKSLPLVSCLVPHLLHSSNIVFKKILSPRL